MSFTNFHKVMSTICFCLITSDEKQQAYYFLLYSFFLGELEKCLEDPDRLAPLFIKQVSKPLLYCSTPLLFYLTASYLKFFQQKELFHSLSCQSVFIPFFLLASNSRNGGCTCTLCTARTNPSPSTSYQSTSTLTLR